jgi:hypothetical protein
MSMQSEGKDAKGRTYEQVTKRKVALLRPESTTLAKRDYSIAAWIGIPFIT